MEKPDLQKLGFKAGIEIHQRLATDEKLFCHCPTRIREDAYAYGTLKRRLRAVAGELGTVDPAAAFEAARRKTFTYQLISENTCLVEQDEEPPRGLNQQALRCGLVMAKMLHAQPMDEVHVMRKTVADGSATSAFQRTALVAMDGHVETSKGIVTIPTVCIEEESSGIVTRVSDEVTYRLDRLGIPLIEIATGPDLQDGAHVQETAEKIGRLLRSTGFVQRGLGTIRQDINVSIADGTRVEIKGAQQLEDLAALAENEALRQHNLLQIAAELKRRGVKNADFANPHGVTRLAFGKPHGVSHHFTHAKAFLSQPIAEGKAVAMAIKLLFTKGLLGKELMPNHRFGTELSGYAKAKAGIKGIIHCDEDPVKYGLTQDDFNNISNELDCIEDDGWAVVVADELTAVRALHAVFDRCYTLEIPKETRKAEGRISTFMRPLPGAARMYPETDVLPAYVSTAEWDALPLPKTADERKADYEKLGLASDMAERLVRSNEWELFDQLAGKTEAKTLAWLLLEVKPALRRAGVDVNQPAERVAALLQLYSEEKITRAALQDLFALASKEPQADLEKMVHTAKLARIRGPALKKLADEWGGNFGEVMKRYRLQVDAGELKGLLEKKK
ncbi:Glu-tRNA(Gln) amidotransferase subunit GatE [Candidatus Micrarchaeota archaeon]|nr:Glu-tRNA(Gln) amidotransferase subunit GatE [Candidatus Micrarchaeota archaeon]